MVAMGLLAHTGGTYKPASSGVALGTGVRVGVGVGLKRSKARVSVLQDNPQKINKSNKK
jgi:hypothetical protein